MHTPGQMEEPLTDNLFGDDSATSSDDLLDDERYGTSAAGGDTKEPPRITDAAVPSGRVLFVRAISAGEDDDRARSVCGSGGEGIGGGLGGGGEEQPSGIGGGGRIGAAADTGADGEQPNETVSYRIEAYEGKEGKGDDEVDDGGGGGGGRAEPPRSARPVKTLPSYFGDPLALNNLLRFPHEGRELIERQRVEGRRRRRRDRRPEVQSTFTRMDLEWAVRGYPLQHYVDPQYEPYHEPLIDSEDEEYDPPDDHFTFEAFDALLDAGIDVNGAIGIDPPPAHRPTARARRRIPRPQCGLRPTCGLLPRLHHTPNTLAANYHLRPQ